MNLFITQVSKREMEGKADVLFLGGYEARRSLVRYGALDYTDGQLSSHRVLHFGKEGPLVLEGRRASVPFLVLDHGIRTRNVCLVLVYWKLNSIKRDPLPTL